MSDDIKDIIVSIKSRGYEAYIVGGYVRNYIWNIPNYDVDIATNCPKDELILLFEKFNPKVFMYDSIKFKFKNYNIDIARFRNESIINGKLKVDFTDSLYDDYLRRDFTFNAVYMDENLDLTFFDNSYDDCINKSIHFIGDPSIRIKEDYTRLFRYIYFVLKYNLDYTFFKFDLGKFTSDILNSNPSALKQFFVKINKLKKSVEFERILKEFGIYNILYENFKTLFDY